MAKKSKIKELMAKQYLATHGGKLTIVLDESAQSERPHQEVYSELLKFYYENIFGMIWHSKIHPAIKATPSRFSLVTRKSAFSHFVDIHSIEDDVEDQTERIWDLTAPELAILEDVTEPIIVDRDIIPAELADKWIAWSPDFIRILGSGDTVAEARQSAGGGNTLVFMRAPRAASKPETGVKRPIKV